MIDDLFAQEDTPRWTQMLAPGAIVLRGFAVEHASALMQMIDLVTSLSPFRHMTTPGGFVMSAAMSNCGSLGWVTDAQGYRYSRHDPLTGEPWPAMPGLFAQLAHQAAHEAGFPDFVADACLLNRYAVGSRMSLHQDKNERDFSQPIVSVSLGLPAIFQFGGMQRSDAVQRIPLTQGDVLVWGGPSRLRFHGVQTIKAGTGAYRFNLTFRKAG